ncbi:hypothetical protein GOBAR_AA18954 [Gossypium barbadense]|uniref:Uncharacterized protein n=1 Tax=Gossypium barbadense TaxID=3634 RepID=A0A2P5XEE1_GOSBA|nr:hypothetical protein GOBAR_AA18954 [Gossypium barbadense]
MPTVTRRACEQLQLRRVRVEVPLAFRQGGCGALQAGSVQAAAPSIDCRHGFEATQRQTVQGNSLDGLVSVRVTSTRRRQVRSARQCLKTVIVTPTSRGGDTRLIRPTMRLQT